MKFLRKHYISEVRNLVLRRGRRLVRATKPCLALGGPSPHLMISQPPRCSLARTTRARCIRTPRRRGVRRVKTAAAMYRRWRPRTNLPNSWSNFSGAGRFFPQVEHRINTVKTLWKILNRLTFKMVTLEWYIIII